MKKAVPFLIPPITVIFAVILFRFVLIIGYVPSESMEPTIQKNSYILGVRGIHDIKTGDIIIFYHEESILVKRVAGCPGDTVVIDKTVYTVPDDSYFVLGDNADVSLDSRYWKNPYIRKEDIIAKLVWP